jgi:hypothetical protein
VKKPYSPPRLACYGTLEDIVKGRGGTKSDTAGSKACWIAEALYGVDAPRTFLVRAWLTDIHDQKRRGACLVSLYIKVGRAVGAMTARSRILQRLLRPLFDTLVRAAAFDMIR